MNIAILFVSRIGNFLFMSDISVDETSYYKVLARKHRPATFSDLIGQDVMVKIIQNSFLSERIAHAFMLTGVRGVGKTTTARIIAKGLNCIGLNGNGLPTISPCGRCDNCLAISNGNHVDVMEFDAASRTGVSDIREIIESVFYRAASARFKIYIIDEVHMLSTSAFNALLKTLEEPPKHVKFIFATTEINKVPLTVLSRCQTFDLKRIEPQSMIAYLKDISERENFSISEDCLGQIARASEGSMRDALSLLEQIFVDTGGIITIEKVRRTLGLADRGRLIDLFESLVSGEIAIVLEQYNDLYKDGADPISLLKELSEITHWITLFKVAPKLSNDITMPPEERSRGKELSEKLDLRELARIWQLLVKILDESSSAFNSKISVEMGLIRVAHASQGPTPDELIKKIIQNEQSDLKKTEEKINASAKGVTSLTGELENNNSLQITEKQIFETTVLQSEAEKRIVLKSEEDRSLENFADVIELIRVKRDLELLIEIENNFRLVNYKIGRIEFEPTPSAAKNLASRLTGFLKEQTGARWFVSVVSSGGGQTIREASVEKQTLSEKKAMSSPTVRAVFDNFPASKFCKIDNKRYENRSSGIGSDIKTEALVWEPIEKE